jgi:hypothetical protein
MDPNLSSDPIIDEIHATRRAMAEKFGGDLNAMLEDARQRQEASGRTIWRPKVIAAPISVDVITPTAVAPN